MRQVELASYSPPLAVVRDERINRVPTAMRQVTTLAQHASIDLDVALSRRWVYVAASSANRHAIVLTMRLFIVVAILGLLALP